MITYEVFAGAEVAADVYDALAKILRWVAGRRIWLVSLTSATLPLVQPPWAGRHGKHPKAAATLAWTEASAHRGASTRTPTRRHPPGERLAPLKATFMAL